MLERLVIVIYWACTIVAGLAIFLGTAGAINEPELATPYLIVAAVFAGGVWLFGRIVKYVTLGI